MNKTTDNNAEAGWHRFSQTVESLKGTTFRRDLPILVSRAPGRLDVMGGVADYSGALVLESTLAVSTFAAAQLRSDGLISIRSLAADREGWKPVVELPFQELVSHGAPISYEEARAALTADPASRWAAYVAGCLHVLLADGKLDPERATGCSILIDSDVPLGAGLSSSASLEVASMSALSGVLDAPLDGMEAARLSQIVENRVVGAPCGIMDQVTCSLGRPRSLMRLLCRPHDLQGYTPIPEGWAFVGIDSGVKHSVGGSNYRRARTAAFMGQAILQKVVDRDLGGYLCSLSPAEWSGFQDRVPGSMSGAEFERLYGTVPDPLSHVEPEVVYRIRSATEHPILEHARVQEFDEILNIAGHADPDGMAAAGRLMLESHRSYSERINLGSAETDLLVKLAMDVGPSGGVYGAKITGGGSGGTVAVLGEDSRIEDAANRIAAQYHAETGIEPTVVSGSLPGAAEAGLRRL
jgi:galactokinase